MNYELTIPGFSLDAPLQLPNGNKLKEIKDISVQFRAVPIGLRPYAPNNHELRSRDGTGYITGVSTKSSLGQFTNVYDTTAPVTGEYYGSANMDSVPQGQPHSKGTLGFQVAFAYNLFSPEFGKKWLAASPSLVFLLNRNVRGNVVDRSVDDLAPENGLDYHCQIAVFPDPKRIAADVLQDGIIGLDLREFNEGGQVYRTFPRPGEPYEGSRMLYAPSLVKRLKD